MYNFDSVETFEESTVNDPHVVYIEAENELHYDDVEKYSVEVKDVGFATFVTPFAINFRENPEVIIHIVKSIDTTVRLTTIDAAPKDTPVIIEAPQGFYEFSCYYLGIDKLPHNELQYNDEPTVSDGTQYCLTKSSDGTGAQFNPVTSGSTIPARKPFLVIKQNENPEA